MFQCKSNTDGPQPTLPLNNRHKFNPYLPLQTQPRYLADVFQYKSNTGGPQPVLAREAAQEKAEWQEEASDMLKRK